MFQHQGIWLPDGEKHFPDWMTRNGELVNGRGTYQIKKLREAMNHCRHFRTAVDVGGHVGLWSMHLAPRFNHVHAFEPVPAFRACFVKNVGASNVILHDCALGAGDGGKVTMKYDPADSGGTHVQYAGEDSTTDLRSLDALQLQDVDFIKVDCEGYEHCVIAGAADTIRRCRPTVIVEQKPHKLGPNFGIKGAPAVDMLREMGAKLVREMSGDFIMVFP